ncbi:MAG: arsenic transporter [Clostridia bacterium]|nr:arsenic transporter [Clostridia bacterium]
MKIAIGVLFIITYVLLLALPKIKGFISIGMAAIMTIIIVSLIQTTTRLDAFLTIVDSIQWNALMVIIGMMGLIEIFTKSGMPAYLADSLVLHSKSPKMAILLLAIFAGLISAITDNVATVLMVVPIALNICKKTNINPIAPIIAISISANLQGAATLVGDTTCIMLANHLNLSFSDFFFYQGRTGLFFVVEISAIIATVVLGLILPKYKGLKLPEIERTKVNYYYPTIILLVMLALLIAFSFIPIQNEVLESLIQGIIVMASMIVCFIINLIKTKSGNDTKDAVKNFDYTTILLLFGLFIIIGCVNTVGLIDDIGNVFVKMSGGNPFALYTILVFGSVLISAFIDNIPYVATMLPVISNIAVTMEFANPIVFYFGMLSGATLGGNITPIGASANITSLGILQKEGHIVKPFTFMKYSIPFTLTAVLCGYGLVWLFFGI